MSNDSHAYQGGANVDSLLKRAISASSGEEKAPTKRKQGLGKHLIDFMFTLPMSGFLVVTI